MAIDLTGFWIGVEDGGFYYLRQVGDQVWWVGMSTDQGLRNSGTLQNGLAFCNVFRGTVKGQSIVGEWADVPRGSNMNSGTLSLGYLSGADIGFGEVVGLPQLIKQSDTGGFGGSTWVQLGLNLSFQPREIIDAFKNISKCNTYWDVADAQYERETLYVGNRRNLVAIEDSVVLFGTLKGPIDDGYPYDHEPSWSYFWNNDDDHGDCDLGFDVNVDLNNLPTNFYGGMHLNEGDAQLVKGFFSRMGCEPLHCEVIMFARHDEKSKPLRPGWAEMNGDSVLVNGRPLNGNVSADATQAVVSIGDWSPPDGAEVRISGALVWDTGHGEDRGEKLEMHPIYALDIITATGIDDLSGAWGMNDGGTCYIRQLGSKIWFFAMPPFANPSYATVFQGTLSGSTISGSWLDLGLGVRNRGGLLTLTVDPGNKILSTDPEGENVFSAQIWRKLYDSDLSSVCALSDLARGTQMMMDVIAMRSFRDHEMLTRPRGRKYVHLLQKHGLEIIRLMGANKPLREQGRAVLAEVVGLVNAHKGAKAKVIPQTLIGAADKLMEGFHQKARPKLKKTIEELRGDLKHFGSKTIIQGLNVPVQKISSQGPRTP